MISAMKRIARLRGIWWTNDIKKVILKGEANRVDSWRKAF